VDIRRNDSTTPNTVLTGSAGVPSNTGVWKVNDAGFSSNVSQAISAEEQVTATS
jgi:hypothetical protein